MRGGKVFLVVGGRGTGKTTFLENSLPPTGSIVVEMFKTDRYAAFGDRRNFDKLKISECVNKKIILEDATQLILGGSSLQVRKLVVSSKQLGSDIYIVFHSVNFIPPFIWAMFDYIILFKSEPVKMSAKTAPYLSKIQQLQRKRGELYKPLGVIEQI